MISLGIYVFNLYPDLSLKIVKLCEAKLSTGLNLISPIIFIGEAVQINNTVKQMFPNLNVKIQSLINNKSVDYQFRLSKHLKRLTGFIINPAKTIDTLLLETEKLKEKNEVHAKCLYIAGLLKGMKIKHLMSIMIFDNLGKIITSSKKKDFKDLDIGKRYYCIFMISSLWHTFGKILEPFLESIFQVLTSLMGDIDEDIRIETNVVIKKIMQEISEYGVKFIIPVLIKRINDKN